jgi:hypothetical protein
VSSQKPQPNLTRLGLHIQRRRQHLEFTQPPVFHHPTPVLEHDEGVFRGGALPLVVCGDFGEERLPRGRQAVRDLEHLHDLQWDGVRPGLHERGLGA